MKDGCSVAEIQIMETHNKAREPQQVALTESNSHVGFEVLQVYFREVIKRSSR